MTHINTIDKSASTDKHLISAIANRWSPRSFSDRPVSDETLKMLFEAARWAASSMNEQPWRFVYAHKGESEYEAIAKALYDGNKWAEQAPVLIIAAAKQTFSRNGKTNGSALYDLGLAVGNLSIQATEEGLSLHQMGGFDKQIISEAFYLDEDIQPAVVIALGYSGSPDQLPEPLYSREVSERSRKPLSDISFHGSLN
ncbi:MAG: nitroreductase family protein [Cyclobacteriaceae bacterium]